MAAINIDKFIENNDTRLCVCEITGNSEALHREFGQLELNLPGFEKIRTEKRKCEFLGVRLALRYLLHTDRQICYAENGKPFLSDNSYQISISHSDKWIAVIVHPTKIVGIDIQCPSKKLKKLYTRFLSVVEQQELSDGTNLCQLQIAWSAKEALYKMIGIDAVDFSKQLRIFPFEAKNLGEISAIHVESSRLYKLTYLQSDVYTLVYSED